MRAAELKQFLLTTQVCFSEFKLSALAFCYCFLLGFDQLCKRCFRHFQLLFRGFTRRYARFLLGDCFFGLGDSRACQFSFAFDRRYKVYDATRQFLAAIFREGKFTDSELFDFEVGTSDAEFLFGADVVNHLAKIRKQALHLRTTHFCRGIPDTRTAK